MRSPVAALIIGACLLAVPACVKPIVACAPVAFLPFQAVYPIDGATSVPDSPQSIVVAQILSAPAISGLQVVLTPPSGSPIVANPGPAPSPLPTPFASPPLGAPLIGFSVPALAAGTTYQITFNGTANFTGVCAGTYGIANKFSFTTK